MSIEAVLKSDVSWHVEMGECLSILRAMPDGCVDALITDPPYSSGGQFRGDRMNTTGNKYVQSGTQLTRPDFGGDNRDQRSFAFWCVLWLTECQRVLKPGAPVMVFTDWRQLPTMTDIFQSGGFVWRGILPWNKTAGVRPVLGRPRAQCEYVIWGSNGPMPLRAEIGVLPGFQEVKENPDKDTVWEDRMNLAHHALEGEEGAAVNLAMPSHLTIPVRQVDKYHQTGKPTALMTELARFCPPGGVILDPFAGSASTGAGALLMNRRFIGIERERRYVEIARERLLGERPGTPDDGVFDLLTNEEDDRIFGVLGQESA